MRMYPHPGVAAAANSEAVGRLPPPLCLAILTP
jgi:hypothetical protein